MKATFKPLSIAVAVATASAGYAGIVNAQRLADNEGLGDLAIVPYYTVRAGWSTGISVINSSAQTQVVKIRMRRAVDSMDALDFNVVLSPEDVWTGYLQLEEDDSIRWYTNDNSCTAPALTGNYLQMPDIYRLGAEEGYIEIMGMGSPINENQPIAVNALHAKTGPTAGIPADCERVRDNFFRGTTPTDYGVNPPASGRDRGVISSVESIQWTSANDRTPLTNEYDDTDNVLKVSYFIKSDENGTEFGNDAVHIADFMDDASITNQRVGITEGDLQGFDHPDLNGGAPTSVIGGFGGAGTGAYEAVRNALGADAVINDWSKNDTDLFSVDTDWVVTTPGQYLMVDQPQYMAAASYEPFAPAIECPVNTCDFRDIPLTVTAYVYDREERGIIAEDDDLVVSPTPPGVITEVNFDREVNVVSWGIERVLNSDKNVLIPGPDGAQFGWANVSVSQAAKNQSICEFTDYNPVEIACASTSTPVPLIGFVAWQRNFDDLPEANYGRIVEHSFATSVAP